jgi:signal transduction histidine kinase
MKIKNRLALYFTLISVVILSIAFVTIFFTFSSFVKADFYERLISRADIAAQLYLEADEITPDSLNRVRSRYQKPFPGEVIRFYDDANLASFIKDRQQYWSGDVINNVRRQKQLKFTEGDRQTVGIYYKDNQGNFVILVSAPDTQGIKRIWDLVEILSIMIVCISASLFFIGRWYAKKALGPIDDIVKQMQLVRASNLNTRVNEGNGKDEISKLAQNFNRLLKHLENAFEVQQTFVTNASHELKTPVTSIIGEIEVALNKPRTAEEYRHVLSSVLAESENLNQTIAGLMELAQVDMNYTQAALSLVPMDELIWEINDYWNEKTGGLFTVNIVRLPAEHEKLQLLANKALLAIALNNIIGNAFKFSQNKPVQCELYADEGSIVIKIIDAGIGIMPNELENVFKSFYRGSNVKDYQGNGIGLYVTSKIIYLFNGRIDVDSDIGSTVVTIQFNK